MIKKLYELFSDFGEIKEEHDDEFKNIYVFYLKVKKIDPDNKLSGLDTLAFLLAVENNECTIIRFRVSSCKKYENKNAIIEIIDKMNKIIEYGIYTIDKEDDINWGTTINLENASKNDIKNIFYSFMAGTLLLHEILDTIKGGSDEK